MNDLRNHAQTGLLTGRTALITGGSSGNGRSIALAYAKHGANVVIADVRPDPREGGEATHDLAGEMGVQAAYVACNVTKGVQVQAAVEAAEDMGGLDVLVNNAGILEGKDWVNLDEEEFDRVMDINVKGVFLATQAAAKVMIPRRRGSIINMASIASYKGSADYIPYSTSKGAVKLLSQSVASSLGQYGILVNSIAPGHIETAMMDRRVLGEAYDRYAKDIPLGRWGTPEDVAGVAVFLASNLARYIHGETIVVDGGVLGCRLPKLG
ncbi:SDR family NAD(P)-dependent oxidoreductase [Paenarthrobacter sp. NPDC057981]|uniref:SDR family NAD(P)-dependent oxidoreductase n=1 Tax=Paenarthrobacter sp. NPDC057981 TaxID=3346297 RepID=UPI0036DA2DEA